MKLIDKNLNTFSGWLLVFLIICFLNIFTSIIMILLNIITLIRALNVEYVISFIDHRIKIFNNIIQTVFGIIILLSFVKIVFLLKSKTTDTPKKVVKYLIVILILTTFYFLSDFMSVQNNFNNTMRTIKDIFTQAGFTVIWVSYFYKSKRVKEYYGLNEKFNGVNLEK